MVIPYATSLVRSSGNWEEGIKSAFRFLDSLVLKPDERDYAKGEVVKIADTIYPQGSTE